MAAQARPPAISDAPQLAPKPPARASPFDTLASAPHSQLLAVGLVVALIGGGLWILRLRRGHPRDAATKASKKRRQAALNRILQAQEAAHSTPSPQPDDLARRGRVSALAAAAADLLPSSSASSACVASTSTAILSGLERIGSAASGALSAVATHARRRATLLPPATATASAKGKERLVEDAAGGGDASPLASPALAERDAFSSALQVTGSGEGSTRRNKGKKGKGAQATGGGLPSPALSHASRPHSPRPVMREAGVSCGGGSDDEGTRTRTGVETCDAGVQTDADSRTPGDEPQRPPHPYAQIHGLDSDPTPRSDSPPHAHRRPRADEDPPDDHPPSVPPLRPPRVDADAPPSTTGVGAGAGVLAAPAPRPPILPIPFDLHASFRSTPNDEPRSDPDPAARSSSASSRLTSSPPLSPSTSTSTSTLPSTSSPSGSPASSRRAHSPASARGGGAGGGSRRRSSAVEVNGHLAVAASGSGGSGTSSPAPSAAAPAAAAAPEALTAKSRKAQRKSSATASDPSPAPAAKAGVVGMPNAVAAPRKSDTPASASASSSPRASANSSLAGRRTSTASSSAGSSAGGGGGGGGVSPMTEANAKRRGGDETVRGIGVGAGVRKRASLQGLGVELAQNVVGAGAGVVETDFAAAQQSPRQGRDGDFPPPPSSSLYAGTRTPNWTSPESSPFPAQPSISGSFAATSTTNGQPQSQPPWSPQQVQQLQQLQQYQLLMSQSQPQTQPAAHHQTSRPPSRGGSLSVPPGMSPHTPQQQQQQQQQQAQQAYAALAAQAQIQAVHVQATYQQAMALHVQRQQQQGAPRRRGMSTGPMDDDGFLSPSTATPATPSGFYPLSAMASPPTSNGTWTAASHPGSPMVASFTQQQLPPQPAYAASPTSASFPGSASTYPYSTVHGTPTGPGPAYLGSPSPAGASVYQQTGYHHQQPQQQYARASQQQQSYPPQRPRLTSSVSSVAVLGSGSASKQSPAGGAGGGGKKGGSADKMALRNVSNGSTSDGATSGGVQLGDPPAGWKNKLRQAEMECERTAKELEIARWRLTVLEEEQRASELDSQEALKALATRAMRAEARIKLLEEAVSRATNGTSADHVDAAPVSMPSPASSSSSPVVPATAARPNGLAVPGAGETGDAAAGSPPGGGVHPLAWLDLDAVSFNTARPLGPPRSPQFSASPKLINNNNRRRNSRQLYQPNEANGIGRRRSNGKRKTSASPSLTIPPTAQSLSDDDDDDDVVIVLDAPLRHRPVPRRSPSRRSSYIGDDEALDQDGSSLLDEDEIPNIDIDEGEPIAGGAVVGESEDGLRLHPEYIGFLPSYLSPVRFGISPALVANGHAGPVPSFVLDVSPTLEPVEFAAEPADMAEDSKAKLEVPTPHERDAPEDAPTPTVKQGHGALPTIDASPPLVNGHADKSLASPVESGEPTPRAPFPPSPPEDPVPEPTMMAVNPASPVDIPLPPSPDPSPFA